MATRIDGARAGFLAAFTGDPGTTLVRARARAFSAGELLGAAEALRAVLVDGSGPLGVAFSQPAWIVAALLAAWSAGRWPVLLDPALKREAEVLRRLYPGIPIYTDGEVALDGRLPVGPRLAASVPVLAPPAWLELPADAACFAALLTSASTGENKVIEKRAFQFYRQVEALGAVLSLPARARVLSFVPPCHLLGLFYGLVLPLARGGETIVATELPGAAMIDMLTKHRPDLVVGTATHYRFLVRAAPTEASLRPDTAYLSSGAPLDPVVAGAFAARFGTAVHDFYGSTELGGVAYRTWPHAYRPMPGVAWRIDAPRDELFVTSPWGSSGQDAWVATGDAAEPEDDGGFRLLGRLDHVVKVGGKRFSTVEVEQALRAMPAILDAAVFTYVRFGESAIAAAVVGEPGAADEAGVRAFLSERLAPYKLPRTILFLPALPRGSHDKVDAQALRALVTVGQDS